MGRVPTKDGLQQAPFQRLLELARHHEDCWVKICGAERISSAGPPFTDAVPFAQELIRAAPDRILWGTDWPHPNISRHMRPSCLSSAVQGLHHCGRMTLAANG